MAIGIGMNENRDAEALAKTLEADLLQRYGPMLTGEALRQVLGYPTQEALRQAIFRKSIPLPFFKLESRRGHFVLVKDVAYWLAERRISVNR